MKITENRLREVIRQVIRESMEGDPSHAAAAPPELVDAIKELALIPDPLSEIKKGASNDDLMQLDKDGYIGSNCCKRIASSLEKLTGSILGKDQIERSCVFPVLLKRIDEEYPDKLQVDLEYVKFRDHLLINADSIAQEMMIKCQEM